MCDGATRATWGPFFPITLSRALTSIMAFRWPHVAPRLKNGGFLRFSAVALGPARGPTPPSCENLGPNFRRRRNWRSTKMEHNMVRRTKLEPAPTVIDVEVPHPAEPIDASLAPWMAECEKLIPEWKTTPEVARRRLAVLLRDCMEGDAPPAFEVAKGEDGKVRTSVPVGRDELVNLLRMHGAFCSPSTDYCNDRIGDLIGHFNASSSVGCTSRELNGALAFVQGSGACDTVQSTLAVQMVATHDAAMTALRRLGSADMVPQVEAFGKIANKLLQTYARQAEVLAKLQRGGEQVIRHVHIDNRGGQAVVTDTVVTGGTDKNGRTQSHEQHQQGACGPALLGSDPLGYGVSIAGHEGEEAVPAAWGAEPRRAQG